MTRLADRAAEMWTGLGTRFLPFADAASAELPLGRLLRLSMFQVSVAMALVLLNGTLNRVMIIEMGMPSWLVALMVSLPLVFAPLRTLVGFQSDNYRSALGWRRVPYIWIGSLLQFGGLAIMPFALIILSGDTHGPIWIGTLASAFAFLLVGAGMHTVQTAGLALATDIAPNASRGRVVAFLYVMLLVGTVASSLLFGWLLSSFSQIRLIQIIQGAAAATVVFNVIALWKQEARDQRYTRKDAKPPRLMDSLQALRSGGRWDRVLVAVALGTAGFSMQDILLEPYGGEILNLSVASTTALTGILALGTLAGLVLAARALAKGFDPYRLAGYGALAGLVAFPAVIFSAPLDSALLFRVGTALIGFGNGLFSVGMLTAAMTLARTGESGIALGAWGAVQATTAGIAIAIGGALRDGVQRLAADHALGPALTDPSVGYSVVYHLEILLLFGALVAIGPLVRPQGESSTSGGEAFGLAEFPS
ncbi:MAG: BCD family MFS transporter [Hyphomicrobium sp.]|nr:BCD family MFS transporter [Hyphomicrobium sp.]